MFTMQGKYNSANVMIDVLDDATKEQIQTFLNHPAFAGSYIAIMPDAHKGNGSCIGFTMTLNDYIIPNIVGVDIGCGMLTYVTNLEYDSVDLVGLDQYIKESIPYGFAINDKPSPITLFGLTDACAGIKYDRAKALRSIGSLGGGNHFIECGANYAGQFCITIHSGSRNLGKCIAEFYQKEAVAQLAKYLVPTIDKELAYIPISTPLYSDYVSAMQVAQNFASLNRIEIMHRILAGLEQGVGRVGIDDCKETIHNYIDFDAKIVRKGAVSAKEGEEVILPFNMRDGIAIGVGKGSKKYNYSAPHGAGRILSRTKAKRELNVEEFQKQMKDAGVYTTTANKDTLDEAPGAYKDKQLILENIGETLDIIDYIQPIYNFKASDEERKRR